YRLDLSGSLVLSAKIYEEDEVIGSVKDLVVQSRCNFSTAEILCMERIILDELNWDLYATTPIDFIYMTQKRPCFQVALWTRQVQHCTACHQLSHFKGSTLGLVIITLELERFTPDWFSVFTDLLKKTQLRHQTPLFAAIATPHTSQSTEFIHCKEMVDEYLTSLEFSLPANAVYICNMTKQHQDDEGACRQTGTQTDQEWKGESGAGGRGRGGGGDKALEVSGDSNTEVLHEAHQKNMSP
ncbi:unnamed protein product, partial [Coregonus sp. 'balchen']